MVGPLRISARGIGLIQSFDGFRARAVRLPAGGWMIGHAHTRTAREGAVISPADARLLLLHHDLPPVEALIREKVLTPLNQNEFDALVSFAWNIGTTAFSLSHVLERLNAGDRAAAAGEMWRWRLGSTGGGQHVIDALVRRRAAEISLFLENLPGPLAIPGPLVRPGCDGLHDLSRPLTGPAVSVDFADDLLARAPAGLPSEAAARSVSDRMSRILAEAGQADLPSGPAAAMGPGADGPSVEDITRAIADLVRPPSEDRPAHPVTGPADTASLPGGPEPGPVTEAPAIPSALIDDLAPVAIDEERIAAALLEQEKPASGGLMTELSAWLPFALLSGLGLVGLFMGLQRLIARPAQVLPAAADLWLAPLLGLGGGMLFLVATYYLYLSISRQE